MASRKPRSHPPYSEMINEAIITLKERTGSSQFAIAKFIEEKQKANLPSNFKKLLLVQLKRLVANGKLIKIKNSFKLPPKTSTTSTAAVKEPRLLLPTKITFSAGKAIKPKLDGKKAAVATKSKKPTKPEGKKAAVSAKTKKPTKPVEKKTAISAKSKKITKPEAKKTVAATKAKKTVAATKTKKPKTIKSPAKKAEKKKGKK